MNRESIEVVAISPELCAETVFLRARDIPDDLFQHADPELFRCLCRRFNLQAARRKLMLSLMTRALLLIFVFTAFLARAGGYTDGMFRDALANISTSPDYVLIKVKSPEGQDERTVCTTANLFLGAIHLEYGLGYTEADQKRAFDIALHQPDRLFTFRKKEAIDNLADHETPEALADVRKQFAGKKDSDLFSRDFINSLTSKPSNASHNAYRDAVAHALLERGIGCRMGDLADNLFPHQ
jgi:hypothetical protein